MIWTDADRAATVQKFADAFGKENGVTTAVQIAVDTRQQFKDATKVGKGPDIVVGAHDWLGELVQNDTVAPVNLSADTAAKFARTGDRSLIWEGHKAGRDIGYCHLEKMHNLEALPPHGFYISCFPHKIRAASAGWTRAVAIVDDGLLALPR